MENMLPEKKKLTIWEKIKQYIEDKRLQKFANTIEKKEKRVNKWNKLTDSQKILFIRTYMENKYIVEYEYSYGRRVDLFSSQLNLYSDAFCRELLADIWKESNYEVQSNSYDVRRNILNDNRRLCISSIITKEFFSDTNPKLQQEIMQRVMDWHLYDEQLEWLVSVNAVEYHRKDFKCNALLYLIKMADVKAVCDIFEGIGNFLCKSSYSREQFLNYLNELPENIRKSQIEDSIYYTVMDKEKFDYKWTGLTYEEKLETYKKIMCTCIVETKEDENGKLENHDWDELASSVDFRTLAHKKIFTIEDRNSLIYKKALLTCNPEIFKTMCTDLKEEDFANSFAEVIETNKENPFALYYFWDAIGTERQNRYFSKVMGVLKDNPISQYELCNAQHMNSRNQKKKLIGIMKTIKSNEDLNQKLPIMQSFIKKEKITTVSKNKKMKKDKCGEMDKTGKMHEVDKSDKKDDGIDI